MKLVQFINYYKPQFQIGGVYGFNEIETKYLIDNNFAIEYNVTEVKAPKEPLNELQSELDINTQLDNKKPVKRIKSIKK